MITRSLSLAVPCVFAVLACLDASEGQVPATSPGQTDGNLQTGDTPDSTPDAAQPAEVVPAVPDAAAAPDTVAVPEADTAPGPDTCAATGDDCRVDAACCSGICSYMGVYTLETTCIDARQLGESCSRDNWCASGFCVNGLCAAGACLEVEADCSWDVLRCCYPSFCSWRGAYAPGYCTPPQPAGANCRDASWCASGMCSDDGVCQ